MMVMGDCDCRAGESEPFALWLWRPVLVAAAAE